MEFFRSIPLRYYHSVASFMYAHAFGTVTRKDCVTSPNEDTTEDEPSARDRGFCLTEHGELFKLYLSYFKAR